MHDNSKIVGNQGGARALVPHSWRCQWLSAYHQHELNFHTFVCAPGRILSQTTSYTQESHTIKYYLGLYSVKLHAPTINWSHLLDIYHWLYLVFSRPCRSRLCYTVLRLSSSSVRNMTINITERQDTNDRSTM